MKEWSVAMKSLGFLVITGLLLTGCAGPASQASDEESIPTGGAPSEVAGDPTQPPTAAPGDSLLFPPAGAALEFTTDFSLHSVDYREILSGGPPKDGIPAIDEPSFVSLEQADEWLAPNEPVIAFEAGGEARAYPLQILVWHEIVNDTVGGVPVLITFCPLCNTAIAFERTVEGLILDFGTTGRLRYSNLIMYDRQTETWWQQASGEAIVGQMTRTQLKFLPAPIVAWQDFQAEFPAARVLSQDTGFNRPYGENPYRGYDDINRSPFLYDGPETPDQLPAMARILAVELQGDSVAFAYDLLAERGVVNAAVGGEPIVVMWQPGTASALDTGQIAQGRDVGAATAYSRVSNGQVLTFVFIDGVIEDEQTGSSWNLFGLAFDGPLSGSRLEPVVGVNHFWFSWVAFKPETRVHLAESN
jgi:hypothetical protein